MNFVFAVTNFGVALFFGYVGFTYRFNKDLAWKWQLKKHRRQDVVNSERTPEWENALNIRSIFLFVISGLFFLSAYVFINQV